MTEYDAFGNPVGAPAPPAGLPNDPPPAVEPSATPTPVVSAPPAQPTFVPSYVAPRRSRGGFGCLIGVLLLIAVPAVIALFVFSKVSDTVDSVSHSLSTSFNSTTTSGSSTTVTSSVAPEQPPHGLSGRSLLRRANFQRAMGEIRRAGGHHGRLVYVRVEAGRIDVQVQRPGGRVWLIDRPWNGRAQVLAKQSGSPGAPTIAWSRVDPAAPQRLSTTVRHGSSRPSYQLNYAVLLGALGHWSAFRTNGTLFTAGLNGRNAQRVGR